MTGNGGNGRINELASALALAQAKNRELEDIKSELENGLAKKEAEIILLKESLVQKTAQADELLAAIRELLSNCGASAQEAMRKAEYYEETNKALRALLDQAKEDYDKLKTRIIDNAEDLVLRYLNQIDPDTLGVDSGILFRVAVINLKKLLEPFISGLQKLADGKLTKRESEIAQLVKLGQTSKEIARVLGISKRAVEFHRDQLRNKLGLKNRKRNLRTYLANLP